MDDEAEEEKIFGDDQNTHVFGWKPSSNLHPNNNDQEE